MFNEKDLQQIAAHGLTKEAVELQIENFRRGFPFLKVVRAASPSDGVVVLNEGLIVSDGMDGYYSYEIE